MLIIALGIAWGSPQLHGDDPLNVVLFAIIVCVAFAIFAGFIMFRITAEVLDLVARGKYTIRSKAETMA